MHMNICLHSIKFLSTYLNKQEIEEIINLSKKVSIIESKWQRKVDNFFKSMSKIIFDQLDINGQVNGSKLPFEEFFARHALEVMTASFRSTNKPNRIPKLARYPKGQVPKSFKELMKLWDDFRKGKYPKRAKEIGDKVKKSYIDKCQRYWKRIAQPQLEGKIKTREEIVKDFQEETKMEKARASTIVQTETTRYWNKQRREMYDDVEAFTHYLFLPIRDKATTAWCKTRNGLVYSKEDPLTDKEQPPIHFNCRSEFLPLTPSNPRHKLLIEDESKQRRNHKCEPLPPNWNK